MLHILKTLNEPAELERCLARSARADAWLLIEDAVYAARKDSVLGNALQMVIASTVSVFASDPDLQVRGIQPTELIDGVQPVDYGGFVDLVVQYPPVQSW